MSGARDPKLAVLRSKIDALDREMLVLLNARAKVAIEVGEWKKAHDAPIYRPEREAHILNALGEANDGPLPNEAVRIIYREIMSACRSLERILRIAYLGPQGTYSEQAVVQHFGRSVEALPCATIDEVFRCVESNAADFGIVPVENSTDGAISRTLDLLLQTNLTISGEVALKIEHHLLTRSGDVDGVARICAHPQSLAQCARWIAQHYPSLPTHPVSSNGEAARMAAEDPTVAAIAGMVAAQRYGLLPVASQIQDDPQNTTRFAVIGHIAAGPSGRDHTSLILSVPNKAGAVYEMLAPLAQYGVSMTRFESRPSRTGKWTYYFYIDIEGHQSDAKVAEALAALRGLAGYFRVLGSYPVDEGEVKE